MSVIEKNISKIGVTLPTPAAPIANYVPFMRTGNLVIISGQLCFGMDGKIADTHKGKIGAGVSPEQAAEAAKLCAINIVAQLKAAIGDLDKVTRCVRLGGFMNCDPSFANIAGVMNAASDFMVAALGEEKGRHARSTVGVAVLPLDAAVEIEAMFEVQ